MIEALFENTHYINLEHRIDRLVHVKQELAKYDQYFSDNIKILGVHIRGKDMNTTQLHPFGPTMEQIFRYTDEMLSKYKIDKIFY